MKRTEEEISIKDILVQLINWYHYFKSKWLIILVVGAIGGSLGFLYAKSKKTQYIATLSFALEDEKGGGGLSGALGLASQFGIDLGGSAGGAFTGANLVELMKSRSLIEKTLLNNGIPYNGKIVSLADYYIAFNNYKEVWKDSKELSDISYPLNANRNSFTLIKDSILGLIYSNLGGGNVVISQRDKKVSILYIDVNSENELFSKVFCEALAKEVSSFYIETKSKKAAENLAMLNKQVDSIRSELNFALMGAATATDNIYNLNPARNIFRVPSSKKQVDLQANTAILTELVKNLELAKVTLRNETPLIQIIDHPILPLEKKRVGKFRSMVIGGFLSSILIFFALIIYRLVKNLDINKISKENVQHLG